METIYKIFEFRVWFLQAADVAVLAFIAWKIILHPICGAIYEWHEEKAKKRRIKKPSDQRTAQIINAVREMGMVLVSI